MKILFVTTISNTVNAFLMPHIKLLIDNGHKVDLAFNTVQEVNPELINMGCRVYDIEFNRNPFNLKNFSAFKKIKKLIENNNYDVVHTHTPVASVLTRLACKNMKEIIVFYTAHGFHFYKGAPPKNWLLYFTIELWLSKFTDVLITINNEDYIRAKKFFKARNIEYIPGIGLDIKKFSEVIVNKSKKRKELGIPENAFVVLSVGELNDNKNHETIIKSISKINNPNIYYVICGEGPLEKYLKKLAKSLGIENRVLLLGYRDDVYEIYKVADIFTFPSKREGLGMAALEAMASGLPIITSNVHGIVDYSDNNKTGYCFAPNDVNKFSSAILKLYNNEKLRKKIGEYNKNVVKKFSLKYVLERMEDIYNCNI